jgi:hemerythrin
MKRIEWRVEFSTGLADIDHEHQALIGLVNDALAHLELDRFHPQAMRETLQEIYAQATAHFALEERKMVLADYDQLAPHKQDHERLLDEILALGDRAEERAALDLDAFADRLSDWFVGHFRTHDARFHLRQA